MEFCEINKIILEKLFFTLLRCHLTNLFRGPHKLKMVLISFLYARAIICSAIHEFKMSFPKETGYEGGTQIFKIARLIPQSSIFYMLSAMKTSISFFWGEVVEIFQLFQLIIPRGHTTELISLIC